jgi:hypothetical protein
MDKRTNGQTNKWTNKEIISKVETLLKLTFSVQLIWSAFFSRYLSLEKIFVSLLFFKQSRVNFNNILCTACAFDIRLYLTPLGQARQFIETCGT